MIPHLGVTKSEVNHLCTRGRWRNLIRANTVNTKDAHIEIKKTKAHKVPSPEIVSSVHLLLDSDLEQCLHSFK